MKKCLILIICPMCVLCVLKKQNKTTCSSLSSISLSHLYRRSTRLMLWVFGLSGTVEGRREERLHLKGGACVSCSSLILNRHHENGTYRCCVCGRTIRRCIGCAGVAVVRCPYATLESLWYQYWLLTVRIHMLHTHNM